MKILCIIPCRLDSQRLARKALLPIQGKPMIQWTYENARNCAFLDEVIVATDSDEIANIISKIDGTVELTSSDIETGSERVAIVAENYPEMDIIINLQGDEPFIKPHMIQQLIEPFQAKDGPVMTTLARKLAPNKYHCPGSVKVITDLNNHAIYFSRSPIPYYRTQQSSPPVYHHIGLYAFRRDFLMLYKSLPKTPLEKIESLEQLRVLEHGYKIQVCLTEGTTLEVNTPEEYEEAQRFALEANYGG